MYRSILGNQETAEKIEPSWRATLNAEYEINSRLKLTFAFGRDFNGTITKSGNVVSFLNLLMSFGGTNRQIAVRD